MGSSQPFFPVLKDIPPPSRSLSSSIWAPQPHPTEASWQQAITSFSQSAEEEKVRTKPDDRRGPPFQIGAPNKDEDVFGPIDFFRVDHKKDVGAIGDGRKKTSPDAVNNVKLFFVVRSCRLMSFDCSTLNSSFVHWTSIPLFRSRTSHLLACIIIRLPICLPSLRHLRC